MVFYYTSLPNLSTITFKNFYFSTQFVILKVSSDTASTVHKRSTPKIAATIIVAFLGLAGLVAATVYFTDGGNLMSLMASSSSSGPGLLSKTRRGLGYRELSAGKDPRRLASAPSGEPPPDKGS